MRHSDYSYNFEILSPQRQLSHNTLCTCMSLTSSGSNADSSANYSQQSAPATASLLCTGCCWCINLMLFAVGIAVVLSNYVCQFLASLHKKKETLSSFARFCTTPMSAIFIICIIAVTYSTQMSAHTFRACVYRICCTIYVNEDACSQLNFFWESRPKRMILTRGKSENECNKMHSVRMESKP